MKIRVVVVDLEIPARLKKWGLRVGIPAVVLSAAAVALAAPVAFTPGQTLTAADLNNDFGYLVPTGAVVAFNLPACPTGWSAVPEAGGRTIIGVNPAGGNGLSARALGDTAGEEKHTMTLSEMPSHTHSWSSGATAAVGTLPYVSANAASASAAFTTTAAGGGAPFNVMQPSLALLYCQKD